MVAVIPAFNESNNIAEIVSDAVIEVDYVVVIDDGSTDETGLKVQAFSNTKVLRNKKNMGKGSSLRKGFIEALKHDPDVIVTLDADSGSIIVKIFLSCLPP